MFEYESLRSELKHHLVKDIIFRLDYDGAIENDIQNCVEKLRQHIRNCGFTNMFTRTKNNVDVNVKMNLTALDESTLSINNAISSLVYHFEDSKRLEKLELCNSFCVLAIKVPDTYKSFDKYMTLLAQIIMQLKKVATFFNLSRIGLRKINICYIKDLSSINKYFSTGVFNNQEPMINLRNYNYTSSNAISVYEVDSYKINYRRLIQSGKMEDTSNRTTEMVYQLSLDIDVYQDDKQKIMVDFDDEIALKNMLKHINDIEFDTFIRSLTPEFINDLKKEVLTDDILIGVE